jgi:hypothetical protein
MLLPYTTIVYFGPGAGAAVITASGSVASDAKAFARGAADLAGTSSIPLAKATRLVNSPVTIVGVGAIVTANPKARAKGSITIKVNALSQDDVTGAVLEVQIEPGLTLKQALLDARRAAKLAAALSA